MYVLNTNQFNMLVLFQDIHNRLPVHSPSKGNLMAAARKQFQNIQAQFGRVFWGMLAGGLIAAFYFV